MCFSDTGIPVQPTQVLSNEREIRWSTKAWYLQWCTQLISFSPLVACTTMVEGWRLANLTSVWQQDRQWWGIWDNGKCARHQHKSYRLWRNCHCHWCKQVQFTMKASTRQCMGLTIPTWPGRIWRGYSPIQTFMTSNNVEWLFIVNALPGARILREAHCNDKNFHQESLRASICHIRRAWMHSLWSGSHHQWSAYHTSVPRN